MQFNLKLSIMQLWHNHYNHHNHQTTSIMYGITITTATIKVKFHCALPVNQLSYTTQYYQQPQNFMHQTFYSSYIQVVTYVCSYLLLFSYSQPNQFQCLLYSKNPRISVKSHERSFEISEIRIKCRDFDIHSPILGVSDPLPFVCNIATYSEMHGQLHRAPQHIVRLMTTCDYKCRQATLACHVID